MTTKAQIGIVVVCIIILIVIWAFELSRRKPTTNWVGHPIVVHITPTYSAQVQMPDVELGLRSDGVVVWRTKK